MVTAATPPGMPERESTRDREAPPETAPRTGIRPILVPLDGSDLAERALPYAEALAAPGCQLILLEVGQDEDEFQILDRHADTCAHLETAVGDPAQQILQVAIQVGAGLIVTTTHGRGALGRWAFGSVADQVARTTPVPVMLIRPTAGAPPAPAIRRIVAPLDGSPRSELALPIAEAIARQMHAPVHLVTAIDLTRLAPMELMPTAAFNADLYEEQVHQAQRDAEEWLSEAAAQLRRGGVEVTQSVRPGSPIAVIRETVQPGDVVVLASHGRHGAARLLLGSLAEQLIRDGSAPVVLVPATDRAPGHPPARAVPVGADAQ